MAHENYPNFTLNDYSYLVIVTNMTSTPILHIIKDYFDQILHRFHLSFFLCTVKFDLNEYIVMSWFGRTIILYLKFIYCY